MSPKRGKLTNDDMDIIKGGVKELAGKLQEKYGWSQEEAEKEMNDYEW